MMLVMMLAMAAVIQDPVVETVVERIELTDEQTAAGTALFRLGRTAGVCAAHLPPETRAAFDAGLAVARSEPPVIPGPALADVVFLDGYGAGLARGSGLPADRCAAELIDGRLLIEGQAGGVEGLIELSGLPSDRPWARLGQAAVDGGAQPRSRPALVRPETVRRGAVRTSPQWAQTPRVAFPSRARGAGREGWASIECIVTTTGRARDCRLIGESAPGFGFGEAALAAEDEYRFRPGTIDGQPAEARGTFRIHFRRP